MADAASSNIFFDLVFQASYGWQLLRRSNLNFLQMFKYWWTQQGIFKKRPQKRKESVAETVEVEV